MSRVAPPAPVARPLAKIRIRFEPAGVVRLFYANRAGVEELVVAQLQEGGILGEVTFDVPPEP